MNLSRQKSGEPVIVRVDGCCGTIILNQPQKQNPLSRVTLAKIEEALADLHAEKKVRAVVVIGSQNAFCSGSDLREIGETLKDEKAHEVWFSDVKAIRGLFERLMQFPKPIISAVNGPALGTGLGIVVSSDIVIGCETATFGLPEPRRGLVAGIVTPLLAFRIGSGNAANLLLRGKTIDHQAAATIGLIHETVQQDLLWAKANEIANEINLLSASSVSMTKRVLYEGVGESLSKLITSGAAATATARTTQDADEGVQAFLEKREPNWG